MCADGEQAMYAACRLCPRECGVNRLQGKKGICGEDSRIFLGCVTRHRGEEPSIAGKNGSGTFFFSGCSCRCFFCQNYQISQEDRIGHEYIFSDFLEAMRGLIRQGVHNLNFVTPEHYWPTILAACRQLRREGVTIPFLWNCSGYGKREMVRAVSECVDVFLPDFKFVNADLAEMCMGDRRYPELALNLISEMVELKGFLRPWDETGGITATVGVMVRHLVLPGQLRNSLGVLDLLFKHFGPRLPLSLMSQFMPMPECHRRGFLNMRVSEGEYAKVVSHAEKLGFEHVYYQEGLGDDCYAPDFTKENPFPA